MVDLTEAHNPPIVTRSEAKSSGAKRYFTGIPCIHGHLKERLTSNEMCIECRSSWYANNRVKVLAKVVAYRTKFPERVMESNKNYRTVNRAKCRKLSIRWLAEHPGKIAEYAATYYEKHPERRLKASEAWRAANPDMPKKSARKWLIANREHARTIVRNRRARVKSAAGKHSAEDIADILRMQRDRCAICHKSLKGKGTVDHINPITLGGSNDRRNLQLVHGKCNSSKGKNHPIDYARKRGLLL